jgi:hypothetical protein
MSPILLRIDANGSFPNYTFEDYFEFEGHRFPRTLTRLREKKPFVQVQVQELAVASYDSPSFTPLPDSHWLHWCPHPAYPKLIPYKGINYPLEWPTRKGVLEKPVDIYGVIGTDGEWHNLKVVRSANQEADAYWMKAALLEHYVPAKCGDVPIEDELVLRLQSE